MEDVWIPSACSICYSQCAILAHRQDGVVTKIEGNPQCPSINGKICTRGLSGIMLLYDPNRVNVPLKRTNPKKGIGVDPRWVEVSWEEALDTIVDRLKKVREEDPRQLLVTCSVVAWDASFLNICFATAFGSPNFWFSGAGTHCGNGEHLVGGLMHASWSRQPDPNYCNYFLNFACPVGVGAYYGVNAMAQRMADARVKGMRHVVIDPYMGMAAEKADEWIPIRPGTDAALALAMINIIIHELGIYDAESLKHHTNAPYLIRPDGYYLRDKATAKPLIWDPVDKKAKVHDDPTIKDFALEGEFAVAGEKGRPAFSLLKEHVKRYTPEMAAEITTVPASTIRRLAREFAEEARVGSTIVIDGKELPYRPVGVGYFKGAQGHKHSALICMALEILAEVVGAGCVPGATLGMNSRSLGHPETGLPFWSPEAGRDGLLVTGTWVVPTRPWPPAEARKPESVTLQELIPTAVVDSPLVPFALLEPEKYGVPYKAKFHFHTGANYLMTLADPELVARAFADLFTVSFSLYLDESTELADIVLPDACYLERLDIQPDWMSNNTPVDWWAYHIRQPVLSPLYQRRPAQEVMLEITERVGMLPDLYSVMNVAYGFRAPYLLDLAKKYTWEEIVDRRYKSMLGDKYGIEWFKKNGVLSWPKKVEEVYWRPFVPTRVPIYFEHFLTAKEQIEKIKEKHGIPGFDTGDFQPLPDWKPCPSHEEKRPEYDLYAIYYRAPFQTFSSTYNNPWLDEVSRIDPYFYHIAINSETARKKGIRDGDWVEVESVATGKAVKSRAKLVEGLHPEVIAVSNCGGHWSKHLPIASRPGKGVCFEWLLPLSFEYLDTVTLNQDLCVRVKVSKAA